jgi:hypothetical protein
VTIAIRDRRDALIWLAVDACFNGGDVRAICRELELDLLRVIAEERLARVDRLVRLLRETDPARVSARRAA